MDLRRMTSSAMTAAITSAKVPGSGSTKGLEHSLSNVISRTVGRSEFPSLEPVLVLDHIHPLAAETHAFHFQARALLHPSFILEFNGAAGAHHALPGQCPAA